MHINLFIVISNETLLLFCDITISYSDMNKKYNI